MTTRLTADRVARHLAVADLRHEIPPAALNLARILLQELDSAQRVKHLEARVRSVIDAGYRSGALAVAGAVAPRDLKAAIGGIRATAALADVLGVGETENDSEVA